jgi:phage terminase large subunit-like protein
VTAWIAGRTRAATRGSTYDNRANLAPAFLEQIIRKYEGTRLGRQELNAEILDDVPGALWNRARIEETRWPAHRNVPELIRIVIAIDPAVSSGNRRRRQACAVRQSASGNAGSPPRSRSAPCRGSLPAAITAGSRA